MEKSNDFFFHILLNLIIKHFFFIQIWKFWTKSVIAHSKKFLVTFPIVSRIVQLSGQRLVKSDFIWHGWNFRENYLKIGTLILKWLWQFHSLEGVLVFCGHKWPLSVRFLPNSVTLYTLMDVFITIFDNVIP